MTWIIVNCTDRHKFQQCAVIPTEKPPPEGLFREGIKEAKFLCGCIENIVARIKKGVK